MKLSYKIAKRFLKSNKNQTVLIILGISVGIAVQLFISLLITGLQESLINKTIGNNSQISITSFTQDYINKEEININNLYNLDDKIEDITYYLDINSLANISDDNFNLIIRGIDDSYDSIYNLNKHITSGKIKRGNYIILSENYKNKYNLKINDAIKILANDQSTFELKISGFYKYGVKALDDTLSFMNLNDAQNLFDKKNKISSIQIGISNKNIFQADEISKNIDNYLSNNYEIDNWKENNEDLLSGLNGQSISSIIIQIFVVVSVVLGISSVLAISVMQKAKQIGILKAMGIKNKKAASIFLIQGIILGTLGAIIGIILGIILLLLFTTFATNPDNTPIVEITITYISIITAFLVAIISSILASLIPALKSCKLNPIDIIRNN
ncbi:MAG: FtsX-like permease family protein [Bacilli bacterium]|nr:FtsX-like permease family protein [Bacilli bacterium]